MALKAYKTKFHSFLIGPLPKGCRFCIKGSKVVLFVTGMCPRSCYYCPISDKKYKKDVIFADEWQTDSIKDIITEAKLIKAQGAGFTGGDPLCRIGRTIVFIRQLKKVFGKGFHIHLYTSLDLVNYSVLGRLYNAGLDEIRFHLDLDDDLLWGRLEKALRYNWDIGIEIPVIPGKFNNYRRIIRFIEVINKNNRNKIKFLNLNELETADNCASKLISMGFKTKNQLSYAVKGSEELALRIIRYISDKKIKLNAHCCTATLKDRVQLANRIKRRAINVKRGFDIVTKCGTLIRGAIYLKDLMPGFKYRENLEKINSDMLVRKALVKNLKSLLGKIKRSFKIKEIELDSVKLRLITSVNSVHRIKDKINKVVLQESRNGKNIFCDRDIYLAVVEEYPTHDAMEVDVEFL